MFIGLPQIGYSISNIPRHARYLNSWLLFEMVLLKNMLQNDLARPSGEISSVSGWFLFASQGTKCRKVCPCSRLWMIWNCLSHLPACKQHGVKAQDGPHTSFAAALVGTKTLCRKEIIMH